MPEARRMSRPCPKCGGSVLMTATRRSYAFWCEECGTVHLLPEDELARVCAEWWEDGGRDVREAEPVQQ